MSTAPSSLSAAAQIVPPQLSEPLPSFPVVNKHGHSLEKKGEKERAASSYVILADLQITEGKQAETIVTLKKSLELVTHPSIKEKLGNVLNDHGQKQEAAILFLELAQLALYNKDNLSAMRLCRLALEAFPGHAETWKTMAAMQHESSETLKILLKGANEPSMPIKERIELCRMVSIKEPEHLQAKLLFLELNQLKMKDKIKRLKQEMKERLPPAAPGQVEKKDSDLAASSCKEDEISIPLSSIGKAEWAAPHLIKNLPAYPQELNDFLAGDCTVWPGKKRSETHVVVPLFKHITAIVNGSPALVLRTLKTLNELDKSSGGVGCQIWGEILKTDQNRPAGEFHYGVLTNDLLPGSRNQLYGVQKTLAESKGYKVPPLLDATTAILWENRRTGVRLFSDANPSTYTRCREEINGYQLVVGCFAPLGLIIPYSDNSHGSYAHAHIGVAGFREF